MLELGRYPTHAEIEAIMARARRMRALYIGMLIARGLSRLQQLLTGLRPRRETSAQRFRTDMG
jgi:hypothetical protein